MSYTSIGFLLQSQSCRPVIPVAALQDPSLRRSSRIQPPPTAASVGSNPPNSDLQFFSSSPCQNGFPTRRAWVSCHAPILRFPRGHTEPSSPLTVAYLPCSYDVECGNRCGLIQNKDITRQTVSAVAQNQFAMTKEVP